MTVVLGIISTFFLQAAFLEKAANYLFKLSIEASVMKL